jgi:hypothetical protein
MKKQLLGAVIVLTGLFALAIGVQAETGDIVVKIDQDFVAGGKALPAGTYTIVRDSPGTSDVLFLRGEQAGATAFLLPATWDPSVPVQPQVRLTRVGDTYYLSEVSTEAGVFTLPEPRVETRTAKAVDHGITSASGSN